MFDGVTDDDEDINDHLLMVPRSASKRSIRVQSAPIIIGDKNSKPKSSFVKKKFEPTVIKPFKMTLRYLILYYCYSGSGYYLFPRISTKARFIWSNNFSKSIRYICLL